MAVGPVRPAGFGKPTVAARTGKTRGGINNLFGGKSSFQTETMALALEASDWIGRIEYPDTAQFATDEAWVAALLAGQSARGPSHGAEPTVSCASLWTLWLKRPPLWALERPDQPRWPGRMAAVGGASWRGVGQGHGTFVRLRDVVALADLASAVASLVEGAVLAQPMPDHPAPALGQRARCGPPPARGADALAWGGSSSALREAAGHQVLPGR